METTPLRRFLQSLCDNSCWNYAVFWKLLHQNQMLLMWEDGYFGTLKVQDSTYNGNLGGDVELAVAYMSTFQYALGDGDVGNVAQTGKCRWLFAGSKSGEFNTASNAVDADEWAFQFASGVKTILLVSVIPYGVLQLGSLELLVEDAQMAKYISNEFFAHQHFTGYSDAFAQNQQFSSTMMTSFDEFPSFTSPIHSVNGSTHNPFTTNLETPTCDSWYLSHLTETNPHTSEPLHQLTSSINSEVIENSQLGTRILTSPPLVSDVGSILSFPEECELHKALVPAFMEKTDKSIRHLSIGDNEKRTDINERSITELETSVFSNHVVPASLSRRKNHNDSCSPSGVTYEGVVNELTDEKEQKFKYDILHQSKKRGKNGAKQKSRPRDRQLIQDRLKDLRELIPDGAKCSIDSLLDRTVKHMLFLESVSDRAIKLHQCAQLEEVGNGPKNNRKPEEKDSQNGASWAVEVGGDQKVCPILVEDLQCPGHMRIEMICTESFRFLEIGEVIHGLRLTILKGVMEKRSGNTWACYIVEAPKGFHRLDIFWPLMKLLEQQQQSPISSKI